MILFEEDKVLKDYFFLLLKCFRIRVLYLILFQDILNHDNKVVADIYPVTSYVAVGSDIPDDLFEIFSTVLSSFFSYFSLGLISRLKEESLPPFSMT